MPGIFDLYTVHADNHIDRHVRAGTSHQISREQVEREILEGLDNDVFPIDLKISWYSAILSSTAFEAYWRSAANRHGLHSANYARYVPDVGLYDFELPPGLHPDVSGVKAPHNTPTSHHSPDYTPPSSPSSSAGESNDSNPPNNEVTVVAATPTPTPKPPTTQRPKKQYAGKGITKQTRRRGTYNPKKKAEQAAAKGGAAPNGAGQNTATGLTPPMAAATTFDVPHDSTLAPTAVSGYNNGAPMSLGAKLAAEAAAVTQAAAATSSRGKKKAANNGEEDSNWAVVGEHSRRGGKKVAAADATKTARKSAGGA